MDEAKLRSIAQLQEFLNATQEISFTSAPVTSSAPPHAIDALLEGVGQLLERLQPTAPGPADPAQQIRLCLHPLFS